MDESLKFQERSISITILFYKVFNKKHNTVWDNVSADIKKEFDSGPVYNKKYFLCSQKSKFYTVK